MSINQLSADTSSFYIPSEEDFPAGFFDDVPAPTQFGFPAENTPTSLQAFEDSLSHTITTPLTPPTTPKKKNKGSGPNSSPKRSLGAKTSNDRKQYGFLPGVVRSTIELPEMEITIPEILCFLPDHIHRPAVIARLMANGYTGKAVADLVNWFRNIPSGSPGALKANTVTKIFTNTMAEVFGDKAWRSNQVCTEKILGFARDISTRNWGWKYQPKGSGGVFLADNGEHISLRDLINGVDIPRWPQGHGAAHLTEVLVWASWDEEDWGVADLPVLLDLKGSQALVSLEPWGDQELLEWWKGMEGMGKKGGKAGKASMAKGYRYSPY